MVEVRDENKIIRDKLIIENTNLVYFVLKKLGLYAQSEFYYDIGLLGLVKAANTYDPYKGYAFTSLAVKCIRNQILMYIRDNKKHNDNMSLDANILDDEDSKTLMEVIPDDFDIEDQLVKDEEIELLHKAILKLKPDEQELLKYYYNDIKLTQNEIADKVHMSQANVSRKIQKIIKKLQKLMKID